MKKLVLAAIIIICYDIPANAILGIGIGVHGGLALNYSYDVLNDTLAALNATYPGLPDSAAFDENLTTIGLHLDIGTLPLIDFTIFGDYAWKSSELNDEFSVKVHDLSVGATVKKKFGATIIKPYVGAGAAMHAIVYTLKQGDNELPFLEDASNIGIHFAAGVELDFPLFPFAPFAEGRYNIISTSEKSTKYPMLLGGLSLKF